ncbi:MAG: DNA polymerase III subunit delta [Saprospiraceae bacterium]
MTTEQLLADLKKGNYQPVYLLHGTEPYFIDEITHFFEHQLLNESEKAFNQMILYGKDADFQAVVDNARRYPMMAPRQVVILKEAQDMKTLGELVNYVERPMPTTILVICHKYKKVNMATKIGKVLKANAVVFEAKSLYDNQVPDWIANYLKKRKLSIDPDAAALLAEYLGTELSKVANELDKLQLNIPAGTLITNKHIEDNIGISKDYNVFELQKALSQRDVLKSNRIINYFASNPKKNPLPGIISSLYNYFSKVYMLHFLKQLPEADMLRTLEISSAFFLKEYRLAARSFPLGKTENILQLLKSYDLKSKGVDYNSTGKPDGELLKELIWHILH